jgi:hypothetical protein
MEDDDPRLERQAEDDAAEDHKTAMAERRGDYRSIDPASLSSPPAAVPGNDLSTPEGALQRLAEIHGASTPRGNCMECMRRSPCLTYQIASAFPKGTQP